MIAPKVLLSGLGFLSIIGGGIAFKQQISELFSSKNQTITNNEFKYLLVEAQEPTTNKVTENNLLSAQDKNKDYFCSFTSQKIGKDDDCLLLNANSTASNKKIVDLYSIVKNEKNSLLETKTTGTNYYVLKISNNKYEEFKKLNEANKKILLTKKSNNNENKVLLELTPKVELNKSKADFTTNFVLIKVSGTPATSLNHPATGDDYKCNINEDKKLCKVYSFSDNNPTVTSGSLIEINSSNLKKIVSTETNSFSTGKYLLIEIKDFQKTEKEIRSSKIEILAPKTTAQANDAKWITGEYVNCYVGSTSDQITNTNLFAIKNSPEDFLVVGLTIPTDNSNIPTSEMITNTSTKHYKCQIDSLVDEDCKLYNVEDPVNGKNLNIENFKSASTPTLKAKFQSNKYFKLVIQNPEFIKKDFSTAKTITITSNSTNSGESNKSYGTVNVIAKSTYEKLIGKSSLFLAKSKTAVTSKNFSTSKCKLKTDTTTATNECDIYKTTASSLSGNDFKNFNITEFTSKLASSESIAKDQYVVIDFKTNVKDVNLNGEVSFFESNGSTGINDYEIVAPLFTPQNSSISSSNIPIILK